MGKLKRKTINPLASNPSSPLPFTIGNPQERVYKKVMVLAVNKRFIKQGHFFLPGRRVSIKKLAIKQISWDINLNPFHTLAEFY